MKYLHLTIFVIIVIPLIVFMYEIDQIKNDIILSKPTIYIGDKLGFVSDGTVIYEGSVLLIDKELYHEVQKVFNCDN